MSVKTQASWNAHALSTRPGMPSGPTAFRMFTRLKDRVTSATESGSGLTSSAAASGASLYGRCCEPRFRGSQLLKQKHRQKHLTWAKEKKNWTVTQWSKVLFSDGSKFCISFGNLGPRVWRKSGEAQNPCWFKSSVKFPQSVMICADVSSAGVGLLCFLKSTVNAAIYQDILEH